MATFFVLTASAGSLLATVKVSQTASQPEYWQYVRQFTLSLLSDCAMRMAAVFAVSTS